MDNYYYCSHPATPHPEILASPKTIKMPKFSPSKAHVEIVREPPYHRLMRDVENSCAFVCDETHARFFCRLEVKLFQRLTDVYPLWTDEGLLPMT